ncbi:MAG TPA: gamma-glutamylcyclotransferase family protein [Pseudonocardia sp.]|uniref:gamma-glutamylcyclotransferase family protein n=1 Tax=Pseudonocardia sp. TaxID=60912 RepID=UPI002B4B1535|nr:gamma-glutamylcyclotransferase family protein [Pseudonocardia sp.]HLU54525.1 gamma-glutamylcyclotransferase family protein [Pseudonocardia sp.]
MPLPDTDFPADPYPGAVPDFSFAHVDGESHVLDTRSWTIGGTPVDAWLARRGGPPCAQRIPLLAYGSNRCPSKITWLRRALGMGEDPVVALRVRTRGVAAVWASGLRKRDGQRPAVLAAAPGVVEEHVLWLATAEQIAVLDRCEGRDARFRLARLRTGEVRTTDGVLIPQPWCYVGHGAIRRPLHVAGAPVRCADVPQDAALGLVGEPGDDGLDAPTVVGAPHPDEWPATIFVYGLLQPGQRSWPLVEPHRAGPPRPASVAGTVYDTGLGYPALRCGGGGRAPGWLVPVRDPAALLPRLDAYEGSQYRRERLVTTDGTICWAYVWQGPSGGLRPLPAGWR